MTNNSKKNIYTFEKLTSEEKNRCAFCSNEKSSTYWLRTRRIRDSRLMSLDYICDGCKGKFDNKELRKCIDCERFYRWIDRKGDGWECKCEFLKSIGDDDENTDDEKKPTQDSQLEKQLHELSLEHKQLEEDHVAGIEATMEATANWYKRMHEEEKEELLEQIKNLKNKTELLEKELSDYLKDNEQLKSQILKLENKLEQITLIAQVEQPLKN